ncbi:hypothetical protein [Pseudomonas weihenstephanensis]|uniref:hypothetical protein n=1 Tax=Pseudomonas weihenstephanensis TaxID=1608994 RepID=UPI000F7A882E|nr:hypothetical protein [Pseudomonas weihenstephanensis]
MAIFKMIPFQASPDEFQHSLRQLEQQLKDCASKGVLRLNVVKNERLNSNSARIGAKHAQRTVGGQG